MIDRSLFLSPDGQTFDGKRAVPNEAVTKLMMDLADLKPGEKVLEIGTGSGYQTNHLLEAIQFGGKLCTMDREYHSPLRYPISNTFLDLNMLVGREFTRGDGRNGWPGWSIEEDGPFDCIFVTCGMSEIPPAYEEQLREGGRLIIPLGKPEGQELLRLEKRNGKLVLGRVGGYCRFQMAI